MKDNNFLSCVGILVSSAALIIVATIADGWALSKVWNWFMPAIFGLTSLTIWKAIGVSMVLALFTGTKSSSSDDSKGQSFTEVLVQQSVVAISKPLFIVGIAWIVLQMAF